MRTVCLVLTQIYKKLPGVIDLKLSVYCQEKWVAKVPPRWIAKVWSLGRVVKTFHLGKGMFFGVHLPRTFLFKSRKMKVLSEYLCKGRDGCGDTGETVCWFCKFWGSRSHLILIIRVVGVNKETEQKLSGKNTWQIWWCDWAPWEMAIQMDQKRQ